MSNTPSSPVVFRLPQSTLVFVVLIFALGALILASSGIDRRASERAQVSPTPTITFTPSITPTPVNPFENVSYSVWTSDDKLISMERPTNWSVQADPRTAISYTFFAEGSTETIISLLAVPRSQVQLTGLTPEMSAEEVLKLLIKEQGIEGVTVRPVQAGAFKGGGFHQSQTETDQITGEKIERELEIWLLDVNNNNLLLLQAITPTAFREQMDYAFARATTSLTIDAAGVAAKLSAAFSPPTPTAAPTSAATAEGTAEATAAATSAATAEPTNEPTSEPTAEPTTVPTSAPTAEPTAEPTAVATP